MKTRKIGREAARRKLVPPRSVGSTGAVRSCGIEGLESRQLLTVTAAPDFYGAIQGTPLVVAAPGLLANDVNTTGAALHVSSSSQPSHGSLTVAPDGSFTYTPTAGYFGPDSFGYTAQDPAGTSGTGVVSLTVVTATNEATVFAGPRLASVSSTQGALLNTLVGGLLGSNVNLTAVNWTGLSNGSIDGGQLADALQAELGVSSPAQALTTNATVAQVIDAAATVAQANGDTAEATALNSLAATVPGLAAPVRLGDLLQVNPNDGSLANTNINALDLVTGVAQLYNFDNVATTPTPITVSGASLGLPVSVGNVSVQAQAVEPPVIVTGPAGTTFHTSAVRLELNLALASNLDTSSLLGPIQSALGLPNLVNATASLGQLSVYTEVAEGSGTIAAVNALAGAVTLQATPGLSNVYLGSIPDSTFFNRARVIVPATDLGFGDVGTLSIAVPNLVGGGDLTSGTAGIQLRSFALGMAPSASTEAFDAPFPQTQTVTTGANFIANLVNSLATNTTVQLSGSLGALLDPLVNGTILPALTPIVTGAVTPILSPVLTSVVNPSLQLLGTGIGELVLTVNTAALVASPIANPDFATTPLNTPVAVAVLDNDTTVAGDTISISAVTQPLHGQAAINPNGTVTYTPVAGYLGPDTFHYTVVNPAGLTSTATVTITVAAPAPPVANPDAYTATSGTPLVVAAPGVLANDTDPGGLTLTSNLVNGPAHGTIALDADGSFTYTPTAGFVGADAFTYRDSDGNGLGAPATVSLTVVAAVAPPVANADAYTATSGTPLVVAATGVLVNDTDAAGLPLTAIHLSGPLHGTLSFNADGSFVYTPNAGFTGADTFTYRDSDGTNFGPPAMVTIAVGPAASPPVANPDAYAATSGTPLVVAAPGVLANDTDPGGLPLTATQLTGPLHGTLTFNPNGSFTYTPTAGFTGADSFTYRDSDGTNVSGPATVTIAVGAAAAPPVANPDTYTSTSGVPLVVAAPGVLVNDTDPAGLPLTAVVVNGPSHGTLTLNTDGSFTYTSTAGFVGTDTFTYRDTDGMNFSGPATVTLAVAAAVAPPVVVQTFPIVATAGVPVVNVPIETFTDGANRPPGTFTAIINYGDGTPIGVGTVTLTNGIYTVTGTHTYANAGVYPVQIVVISDTNQAILGITMATVGAAIPVGASIGGEVYLDANKNGHLNSNEFGIAQILVTLTGTDSTGHKVSLSTRTDAHGNYSFAGLQPGKYQIKIAQPSAFFSTGSSSAGSAGGSAKGGQITNIKIGQDVKAVGYNFGETIKKGCKLALAKFKPVLQYGPHPSGPPVIAFPSIVLPASDPIVYYLPDLASEVTVVG